jgi:hypothetical protein
MGVMVTYDDENCALSIDFCVTIWFPFKMSDVNNIDDDVVSATEADGNTIVSESEF